MRQRIYLGADHAAFALKERLGQILAETCDVVDCGPAGYLAGDDYPDYAERVCRGVLNDRALGILMCDTGIGMSIAANRYLGIRAALVTSEFMAERSRRHNNANILCLGQEVATLAENEIFVRVWLATPFAGESRHTRRLNKLDVLG